MFSVYNYSYSVGGFALFCENSLMFPQVWNVTVELTRHAVSAWLVLDDFLFYKDPTTDET